MKRFGAVSLALLYALPSTWALQGGLDLLRSPRVPAAAADGKCAPHGCGCDESARTRQACCCVPIPGAASPESALEASRCGGTEAAVQTLLTPPAFPSTTPEPFVPLALDAPDAPSGRCRLVPPASPPEKVPIA